jgi:ABC-type Fe3+ transport system permease subunit
VPLIFLVILLHKRRSNINHRRSIFQDVAIGLSVGISAHLIGDALWQSISISTISLCILIFFGLVIPFFVIHQLNENSPKK